jgi:hypothetical protein
MMKNVAGNFKLFNTGIACLNWLIEPSSNVIDTAPFLPSRHCVISVLPITWALLLTNNIKDKAVEINFFMGWISNYK